MPADGDLTRLQQVIDASVTAAGPALSRNFVAPGWVMSAEEFVAFWGGSRMCSISTASATGKVHVAPLDVELRDGHFFIATFSDAVRLRDHRANPRCALATWDDAYHAAIVYGTAHIEGDIAGMVTVRVDPDRIYAIRAPAGHPAAR